MDWAEALAAIGTEGPVGTVLYIGSGSGAPFVNGVAEGIGKVILVDPNPAFKRVMTVAARAEPRLGVLSAAVAEESGRAAFRIFNAPQFSSLLAPAGLKDILPNLKETRLVMADTLSPADLIDRTGAPDPAVENVLVLDAPGVERTVLTGFEAAGVLTAFGTILLRVGDTALFEDGWTAAQCLEALDRNVYQPEALDGTNDMLQQYRLGRDLVEAERRSASETIGRLEAELAEAKAAAAQGQEQMRGLDGIRAELETRVAQADAEISALRGTAETLQEKEAHIGVLTERNAELEAARAAAEAREAGLMERIGALDAALEQSRAETAEAQKIADRVTELETDLAKAKRGREDEREENRLQTVDLQGRVLAQVAELAAMREERDTARALAGTRETEAEAARAAAERRQGELSMALRLQELLQSDLKELRDQYKEVVRIKTAQEALLLKLQPRLQRAADYLREHPPEVIGFGDPAPGSDTAGYLPGKTSNVVKPKAGTGKTKKTGSKGKKAS